VETCRRGARAPVAIAPHPQTCKAPSRFLRVHALMTPLLRHFFPTKRLASGGSVSDKLVSRDLFAIGFLRGVF
jgi:hypothetical protein